jgi:hypothetical protein
VYGNLQGGQEKVFDGYVIEKPAGEQVLVTKPTPHFGFIIQSRFKECLTMPCTGSWQKAATVPGQ